VTTWKLEEGCPATNCSPTTAASPAKGSGPGRRTHSSLSRQSQGRYAHTLIVVHDTHVTDHMLKPKTIPASSAPPKRIPSVRPSRNAPSAATRSFSAAMGASESRKGST
jgi:hypothetical protein